MGCSRGKNKIFCRISTGDVKPSPVERPKPHIPGEFSGLKDSFYTYLNRLPSLSSKVSS